MTKLILVNSLSNGGGERIATNVANELSKTEKVIVVILEKNITYTLNKEVNIITLKKYKLFNFFRQSLELKNIIKKYNIDLVQSHLYRANLINVLCKSLGSPHFSQIVNHGDPLQYKNKGIKGLTMLILIKLFYPKSNEIIAISKAMNQIIHELLPNVDKNKIITINNPYNIDEIIKKSNENSGFSLPNKYLVSMGRLIKSKNFNLLIKSVKDTNISLVIIGSGPEENSLKAYTQQLGLSEKIIFLGHQDNPFPIIKNSVALISASRTEGFPNVIIEALACSTPVIHSDCISGPREILQPKSSLITAILQNGFEKTPYGILYAIDDYQALISAIHYITSIDLKEMKNNCIKRAYDFDAKKIIKNYFE
ncbi:glycosyltransferase [Proteus mirabilis]|uniref:glycosyltransferase n=1 Tax=Proteus mirabilis TaxID=584 RepID=UPI002574C9AD|nr:glycosyltransferase [Proteus mirabilis]MDM3586026.1 glycosyltransferase [Proteus mirabilis]MDM3831660.1 glycosyltransferase [Proteus mirabilis]MEC4045871.1 glycosyltransferase [Proteus mirabilis]